VQRLLVDLELLGAVSLSEAESRSVLDERALVCGRRLRPNVSEATELRTCG
jgi:hypothetical protein